MQIAHYRLDEESERLCLCSKMKYGSAGGVHIALSPGGGYVLVPCWKSADVIACALDECGDMKGLSNTLKMPEGAGARMRQTQPNPHQIVFDKSGTYFAVPDLGADRLHIIRWNEEDGSMERVRTNQADPGDGPRHGVFHPVHDWFYLFAELECAVYFYEFHGPDPMSVRRQKIELIPRSFGILMRDRRFKALKLRYPRTEGFCLRVCGGILQSRDMTGLYAWILIPGQVHSPIR